MNFSAKWVKGAASVVVVLAGVACALEMQPLRRVDSAFHGLLKDVEKRKWKAVSQSITADYHDRWGFNHASLMENLPQAFRHFYVLEIKAEPPEISLIDREATVKSRISIEGSGTAIADRMLQRTQGLTQPFVFTFRRRSWKPWDWKLETVDQPELQMETSWH